MNKVDNDTKITKKEFRDSLLRACKETHEWLHGKRPNRDVKKLIQEMKVWAEENE